MMNWTVLPEDAKENTIEFHAAIVALFLKARIFELIIIIPISTHVVIAIIVVNFKN